MFLFDLLFGKRDKTSAAAEDSGSATPAPDVAACAPGPAPANAAPGTKISYSPELIAKFKHDHQQLLQLFGATKAAATAGDVVTAAARLDDFRGALQGHLLNENIRLYIYLEHALAANPDSHALVRGFRHEMDEIGKAVVSFLAKYRELASKPELAAPFSEELDGVGAVLVQRIQREEETLYPLYMPSA